MKIELVIGKRGRAYLVHDAPFEDIPLWVRYLVASHEFEIIFNNGQSHRIGCPENPELQMMLNRMERIMIVRKEGEEPVESSEAYFMVVK